MNRGRFIDDPEKFKRKHCQSIYLNDLELQALATYCKRYKVKNKAKFIRETLVTAILKQISNDSKLF